MKIKQIIIAEDKNLNEFALPGGDDREPDEDEILYNLAKQWWLGTEQDMIKAERTLASMGWEIGEDEGSYDNGGVFVVRAGDEHGKSYQSWPHEELIDEGQTSDMRSFFSTQQPLNPAPIQSPTTGPVVATVTRPSESVKESMPASVLKNKQRNASMTDQEFHQAHKDKSEDELKAMAWRHGYGKGSTHYVDKHKKGQGVIEGKDDYVPPKEADYDDDYQDMVKRVGKKAKEQEQAKKEKSKELDESTEQLNKILKLSGYKK